MTEDEMLALVKGNADKIKDAAINAVIKKVEDDLKYHMPSEIRDAISTFMAEEVAPAVVTELQSQKGQILKAVKDAGAQIGATLQAKLVENATENLTGWKGGDILKKLVE